jgi:hypothetical protein
MIMAALDNALEDRAMQRHFARDPVSWAARTYLSMETMSMQWRVRTRAAGQYGACPATHIAAWRGRRSAPVQVSPSL